VKKQTAILPFMVLGTLIGSSVAQQTTTPKAPSSAAKPAALPAGFRELPFLVTTPVRTFKTAPKMQLDKKLDYAVAMDTSKGRIVLDLFETDTPTTVNSFVWLARNRYYEGISFHRVIDKFVVQGGDSNTLKPDKATWGGGGPGYEFGLELRKKLNFDSKGILGMARSGSPDSNGSQFYITLEPVSSLNNNYTVFGKVIQGLDVLDKITKFDSSKPEDAAKTPDKMTKVTIIVKNK
jgi:cyclophilin family peptidyl-prolyl cis-trans isomerase